uniref:F-box associated domain-containing protein n=1 Tax=Leersia perrieri TaxID=77586 RepID=A0A0D9VA14_9ORYZ
MALPRRFPNQIVENRIPGLKSLRCINLKLQNFFNATDAICIDKNNDDQAAESSSAALKKMDRIHLPSPIFNLGAANLDKCLSITCFPLSGRELLCVDQDGRTILFDADDRSVVTMADLNKPKRWPISIFIPNHSSSSSGGSGSLFIMETIVRSERHYSDHQFEEFLDISLPLPPFVRDPNFSQIRTNIISYAVVSGGSEICISVNKAGTYCFHTVNHTWRHVGDWALPFHGKVEYVPELKLWFGLSDKTNHLAAADLSIMEDGDDGGGRS